MLISFAAVLLKTIFIWSHACATGTSNDCRPKPDQRFLSGRLRWTLLPKEHSVSCWSHTTFQLRGVHFTTELISTQQYANRTSHSSYGLQWSQLLYDGLDLVPSEWTCWDVLLLLLLLLQGWEICTKNNFFLKALFHSSVLRFCSVFAWLQLSLTLVSFLRSTNRQNPILGDAVVTAPDLGGGQGARAQGLPPKRAPHHVHVFSHMCYMCVPLSHI